MPSTYTGSGIELIGNGEQAGTWGQTTNINLQIVNRLTSEAGAIALSGTTHTLTVSDGVLSDGQYSVLVFGGSPSGTNTVTISPNDSKRVFIVSNTSGQTVVLTQGSGGNVTVLNNGKAIVYSNGAGASAAVVDITPVGPTLAAIGALTPTDGNFIVGNGTTWVAESGDTVLTSIGVTATATELNTLDGITATTAELNVLDGITATTAELNILDGVTATTAELNFTDGVTSNIQTQLDGTVKTTGDQNVAGVKTFSSPIVSSGVSLTSIPAGQLTDDIAAARITTALNAGGSAPIYACRAWVNFNGTGTVAIRESGNVSSITDNGAGDYTVNFTTAMSDANYSTVSTCQSIATSTVAVNMQIEAQTTTTAQLRSRRSASSTGEPVDAATINVAIFR
jgi:hypothetical protein